MKSGVCPDCEREISLEADSCPHCDCLDPFDKKTSQSTPSFWSSKLAKLFAIDPRSLALFRIATALVLLYDLAGRVVDVRAFYSDEGIVTIAQQREVCHPWLWSLNFLDGSVGFQTAIFVVAFIFATALLVGFATRLATIGCWILTVSIHIRGSIMLVNGGDILLTQMLFWSMFLPLGKHWSLDSILSKRKSAILEPIVSMASVAILLQIFFMYFFTVLMKLNDIWYSGQALENALSYEIYVTPLGGYLLHYPGLLKFLTYGILCLEFFGPFLFFIPWKTAYFRLALGAAFVSLHIAIEMTMTVALFSYMCISALMLFLPREFWTLILRSKEKENIDSSLQTNDEDHKSENPEDKHSDSAGILTRLSENYRVTLRYLRDGFVSFMLLFVFLWNINSALKVTSRQSGQPRPVFGFEVHQAMLDFSIVTSVNQFWFMFDEPSGVDTWYVAEAQLRDGSRVDVLKNGAPISEDKPDRLYANFRNHRWKMLYIMLSPQEMSMNHGKEIPQLEELKQKARTILNQMERKVDRLKEARTNGSATSNSSAIITKLQQEIRTTRRTLVGLNENEQAVLQRILYRDGLADYLLKEWNEQHNSEKHIVTLNLRSYTEIRPPGLDEYPYTLASSGKVGHGNYFRKGMRQGLWNLYDENGNKAKGSYIDNKKEGLWTEWYPNGQKNNSGKFVNDRKNGNFTHWAPDGRKIGEAQYLNGMLIQK